MKTLKSSHNIIDNLVSTLFRKRGFRDSRIITEWNLIIGPDLAQISSPLQIDFADENKPGILRLAVMGSASVEIHHMIPTIIDRVNAFCGYKAIDRVSLVHHYFDMKIPLPKTLSKTKEQIAPSLGEEVENITNDDLKKALLGLGQAIHMNKEDKK
jgi:hypothetical protein